MQRPGRKDNDQTVVSDEDLQRISDYFWTAIDTPRGLIQKVWFDLMLHLGADGEARLSRVYPNFCTQILPAKEKYYSLFRVAWTKLPKYQMGPYEVDSAGAPMAPFKLCQQCLVPVKSHKNDRANGAKGILCSVACYEAFMHAKEMRQQQLPQPVLPGSSGAQRSVPSILRGNRVMPFPPPPPSLMGKNLPPEVYKFIQQVARIQACGYPSVDGTPLLFKEDYSPVAAEIPKDLYDLTLTVLNSGGPPKPSLPPPSVSSTANMAKWLKDADPQAMRPTE